MVDCLQRNFNRLGDVEVVSCWELKCLLLNINWFAQIEAHLSGLNCMLIRQWMISFIIGQSTGNMSAIIQFKNLVTDLFTKSLIKRKLHFFPPMHITFTWSPSVTHPHPEHDIKHISQNKLLNAWGRWENEQTNTKYAVTSKSIGRRFSLR